MNNHRINFSECPVCGHSSIEKVLTAKDHTVSQELFEIWHCNSCSFRFTQSIPDADSIGPYYQSENYVSHSDTQEGLIHKCYHLVRSYTLKTKKRLVQKVSGKEKGVLLDVGSGTGAFAKTMQDAGWDVTGLEPDERARKNAFDKNGLSLLSPERLYELKADTFDAISLWHVLEHVHDLHGYVERFHQLLRPDGKLIIAVPNYTSHDAAVYREYWAAYDVPRHLYHFSPESMTVLAATKGFRIDSIHPLWFDSFYVSMLSETYKTGKSNLLSAVWNGFVSNLKTLFHKKRCSSVIYILSKK